MVMTIELRDIEYFVAVAERGNVGRAAESLGLSQPALSKSLRRLESSLRTKLVKKVPKGIELTAVGTAFLAHVGRLKLSLDDVSREVSDLTEGRAGHLRVGANHFAVDYLLPEAGRRLMESAPKLTWAVTLAQNDALLPALREGVYDLIIAGLPEYPQRDLVQQHLLDNEFVVVVSARHPLARKKNLSMANLTEHRWALSGPDTLAPQHVERAFANYGLPPPVPVMCTNAPNLLLHLVAHCGLVGFQPKYDVRRRRMLGQRLVELRVPELNWVRRLGLSYRRDAYLSPAALRFIELLKATAKEFAAPNREGTN